MKQLIPLGAILAIVGLILLAYPFFTTQQTKEVAHVGPLHVDENQQQTHMVPPILSLSLIHIFEALAHVANSRGDGVEARIIDPFGMAERFREPLPFGIRIRATGDVAVGRFENQIARSTTRALRRRGGKGCLLYTSRCV